MGILIAEPTDHDVDTNAWQTLLLKLTATTGGLMLIDFTEKQSVNVPQIIAGSRFEINGSFYKVISNEAIQNWTSINNGKAYVYAVPMGGELSQFVFNNTAPTYQVAKGGWYHPTESWRCIMSCYKQSSTQCRGKALMGVKTPFYDTPTETEGVQVVTNSTQQSYKAAIEAGWYRVELRGGNGGNGGDGAKTGQNYDLTLSSNGSHITLGVDPSLQTEIEGGSGTNPGSVYALVKTLYLWLEKGIVELKAGRTGRNGGTGRLADYHSYSNIDNPNLGYPDGGNGGNGEDGEESLLLNNGITVASTKGQQGGVGGKGASGNMSWYRETSGVSPTGLATWKTRLGRKERGGRSGWNGQGYTDVITGYITLYIL